MRFNNDKPIFAQIADMLAGRILEGDPGSGERLPSARELAESLEVNPNTAARALQELADQGLARCERGMGYFVAESGTTLALEARRRRFFEAELPALFERMAELGVGMDEVARLPAERGRSGREGRSEK